MADHQKGGSHGDNEPQEAIELHKGDRTQRHGMFKGLPPLSIPKALRQSQTARPERPDLIASLPQASSSHVGATTVNPRAEQPMERHKNQRGASPFGSAMAQDSGIRSRKHAVTPKFIRHTDDPATLPSQNGSQSPLLVTGTPCEAKLTGADHHSAKFGVDEWAAGVAKNSSPGSAPAPVESITGPATALYQTQSPPMVLHHGASSTSQSSQPTPPIDRFNEEDGILWRIKHAGGRLAAAFVASGSTPTMSPVAQSPKLRLPDAKPESSAKGAAVHEQWSTMSRTERVLLRNQVQSDMSAFSWPATPWEAALSKSLPRPVSPGHVESPVEWMDRDPTEHEPLASRTKQEIDSKCDTYASSLSPTYSNQNGSCSMPSDSTRSAPDDAVDESSEEYSPTSGEEDECVALLQGSLVIDSARPSMKHSGKVSTTLCPTRSRGQSIGLPDCSQDAMVRAAMFEKKLSRQPAANRSGVKEPGGARVDLMGKTSMLNGFQPCDVRYSAQGQGQSKGGRVVRVRGETL